MKNTKLQALHRRWKKTNKRTRRIIRRGFAIAVFAVVAGLLYYLARDVDWADVWRAVQEVPKRVIAIAAGITMVAFCAYSTLDLLGKRYVKHNIPSAKVVSIAMLSYAMNINLGMLLGGFGVRLRLYLRMGCRKSVPTRVTLFSALSNWLGFGLLAGVVFTSGLVPLPGNMAWGQGGLRIAGVVLLLLSGSYLLACYKYPGRTWTVRRWRVVLPGVKMAAAQCLASALSWALMGLVFYTVLQGRVPYVAALGVLLYASIAALVVRVPGGLGTTEAIAVAALSQFLPSSEVLAGVLTYRAVYFLFPLVLALLAYAALEIKWSVQPRVSGRTAQ